MDLTKSTELVEYRRSNRVAVVGAGAAGLMVAARLLELGARHHRQLDVLLIDPTSSPGRGVAYSTRVHCHLLNVPAGKMSAVAGDPGDFVRWLNRTGAGPVGTGDFVPRERFGAYLAEHLDAVADRVGTARLHRIQDTVVGARPDTRGVVLELASGRTAAVSAAVVAVGALPPGDQWAPPALRDSSRFIADPWARGAIERVPATGDVLLVGTGLTMVDMAMVLDRPGRVLHAVSRRGLLPRAHSATPSPAAPLPDTVLPDDLPALRHVVVGHIKRCLRERRDWRPAVDGLRPRTTELWKRLSDSDRATWLARDAPYWDVRRHRMPPAVATRIASIRQAGRLRIRRGEVADVAVQEDGLDVTLADGRHVRVGAVINCTGPSLDAARHPLVNSLVANGLARPGPLGLGLDTASDGRLAATDAPLWTIGVLRKGNLWETTAFPEIRAAAAEVARAVLDTIGHSRKARRPRDSHGLELSTTSQAARSYRAALDRVLCVQSGARPLFEQAVAADPGFALGHAAMAVLHHEGQHPTLADASLCRAIEAARQRADDRERSFVAAVAQLLRRPDDGAAALLCHIEKYPRDAFAVSIAVPTIAFGGVTSGEASWALIEGLSGAYGDDWWYQSQLAFVRQDQGRWHEAETLATTALARQPSSGHAVHARTHVYYETAEHEAGLAWLDDWITDRGPSANYRAHFSWHAALHELVLGDGDAVRKRYASQLAPPAVSGLRALVDSASLLWRCRLSQAWHGPLPIGDLLESCQGEWLRRPPTTFAALHAALALAVAEDTGGLARLRRHAEDQGGLFQAVVAPLCTGLSDLVDQQWNRAATTLLAITPRLSSCGGSAAQREVVEDTLIHALIRAGRCSQAAGLLEARLDRRSSPSDTRLLQAIGPEGKLA